MTCDIRVCRVWAFGCTDLPLASTYRLGYHGRMPKKKKPVAPTTHNFSSLLPDLVIHAVETVLGVACTNICRPLNSYINRVYEVGLADGCYVVAKFYRPGRWSRAALQDELDFLAELHAAELPVVAPLRGRDGALLHLLASTYFAIFPKKGGRPLDEPTPAEWVQLGRLIARMHAVGSQHAPRDRIRLHPAHSMRDHLSYILESNTVAPQFRDAYAGIVTSLIDEITPMFDTVEMIRIHGDCHRGNILCRPDEGYHLLDFDDMAVGPAVQDLWMILPDRVARAHNEMDRMLEGYRTFFPFNDDALRLIEPLRAMRYVHFTAWCARQMADGGFARLAPGWGTPQYWREAIADLQDQQQAIRDALASG